MLQTVSSADQRRRARGARMEGARMEVDNTANELFPSKVDTTKRAAMDSIPSLSDRIPTSNGTSQTATTAVELFPNRVVSRAETVELFPQKVAVSGKSLLERIQDDEGGRRELFPEKVGGAGRRNRRKAEDHF